MFKIVFKNEIFRFLFSGGVAFGSNILIFAFLLNFFHLEVVSSVFAFLLSVLISFLMQKYFTFKHKGGISKKEFTLFFTIALFNLLLNTFLFLFFHSFLSFNPYVSQVCSAILVAFFSFFIYRNFIFKTV